MKIQSTILVLIVSILAKETMAHYYINCSTVAASVAPGSPLLSIRLAATNTVLISWPSPSTGFILQQTPNVDTTSWTTAPQVPVDDGTTKSVVVNPPIGKRFYRLKF